MKTWSISLNYFLLVVSFFVTPLALAFDQGHHSFPNGTLYIDQANQGNRFLQFTFSDETPPISIDMHEEAFQTCFNKKSAALLYEIVDYQILCHGMYVENYKENTLKWDDELEAFELVEEAHHRKIDRMYAIHLEVRKRTQQLANSKKDESVKLTVYLDYKNQDSILLVVPELTGLEFIRRLLSH